MLVGLQKPYTVSVAPSLRVLDLNSNQLWDESLLAANNSLSGPFLNFICSCPNLQVLDLSFNNLSGSIPHCLFERVKDLQVLNLGRNNISGRVPDTFAPNCSLITLDLNDNDLVGDVPLSLGYCIHLAVMNVGNNHITGDFPCMLPSSLQVLVLRSNRFHGEIRCKKQSWPNLQIIDISSNNFTGYLNPFNFSSWKGMKLGGGAKLERKKLGVTTDLNFSYKDEVGLFIEGLGVTTDMNFYYKEKVTLVIKGLELSLVSIWPEFTSIDFSCNNFHGVIPQVIGDLSELYLLNLSHNALTGTIPKSFSELRKLGALDLSMNQLTGKIPEEIARLTFLQMMNVSHNKLVGKIPIGPQIQTFTADSFEGNTGLYGLPLNNSSTYTSSSSLPKLGNVQLHWEIEWDYVFASAGYVVGLGSTFWVLLFCRRFREKYFENVEDVIEKMFDRRQRRKSRGGGRRVTRNQVIRRH